MATRIILFSGLSLLLLGIFFALKPSAEPITLTPPSGYAAAQKIEVQPDAPFVSALEYAQAFAPVVAPAPEIKPVVKHTPKRHIAKTKAKKLKLVAKR